MPINVKEVKGSNGDKYKIKVADSGVLYCSCPAWKFSNEVPKSCKHLLTFLGKSPTKNGKKNTKNYTVLVSYPSNFANYDQRVRNAVKRGAVNSGSGFGSRYQDFVFTTRNGAKNALGRVRGLHLKGILVQVQTA